jgi:hypothetical protein
VLAFFWRRGIVSGMPQSGLIFRALIASPSDCIEERRIIPEVIAAWNAVNSESTSAIVEPVKWETHARPAMGGRPQGIINSQLVDGCDMVVGAFWTRLGTPTGESESGTAEESERVRAAGKPVLLYFSSAPVVLDSVDGEQYKALVAYRDKLKDKGLYFSYDSPADFREIFQRHFASTMIGLLKASQHSLPPSAEATNDNSKQVSAAEVFRTEFNAFLRKLGIEWKTERDCDATDTDEAKRILSSASTELIHFRSMVLKDTTELSAKIDEALKRIKQVQRHQFYMDGGESFRAFWNEGDAILALLQSVPDEITKFIEDPDEE